MPPYAGVFSRGKDKSLSGDYKNALVFFCLYFADWNSLSVFAYFNNSMYAMIWMGMNGGIGGASVIMVSDRVQMVAFARPRVWAQKKPD